VRYVADRQGLPKAVYVAPEYLGPSEPNPQPPEHNQPT
jgi:hypothetical protein